MEEIIKCPICYAQEKKLFLKCKDFTVSQKSFDIQECLNCGFKYTSPRPLAEDLGQYYKSNEYISHSDTRKGIVNKLYHWVRSYTLIKKLKLILRYSKTGRILDYGCGTGAFLETCQKAKWEVYGIEPDSDARRIAGNRLGIIPEPDIDSFCSRYVGAKFDVITLWHVLEHIPDLEGWFKFISEYLDRNGTLVIAVPNCSSYDAAKFKEYWAAYDVPRHLYHFTPKDIDKLFSRHGYRLIKTLPMVFDAFYVSMLSQKYKVGKSNLVSSFLTGLRSNFNANKDGQSFSSQIYILRRN